MEVSGSKVASLPVLNQTREKLIHPATGTTRSMASMVGILGPY